MSADVQFSAQNEVKTRRKNVITSAYVQFSAQNRVKTKSKREGHHVRRPLFVLKLPKIICGRMISHVFSVHNAGHLGIFWRPRMTDCFLLKRRTCPSKRERMVCLANTPLICLK